MPRRSAIIYPEHRINGGLRVEERRTWGGRGGALRRDELFSPTAVVQQSTHSLHCSAILRAYAQKEETFLKLGTRGVSCSYGSVSCFKDEHPRQFTALAFISSSTYHPR